MAIISADQYLGAVKHRLTWMKTGTRTLVAAMPYTVFDIAGSPGVGTLAIGNTANGVVPDDTVAGYPLIPSFVGQKGYLARIEYGSSVASCFDIFDRLFAAGAYAYNANVALSGQPSFAGRLPNGLYNGLSLWVEAVTAFTGVLHVTIQYLDQDGNAATTGDVTLLALPVGRAMQIPLAAGDSGIQKITNVLGGTATAGTFNVMILRSIGFARVKTANDGDVQDFLRTGFPEIFDTSAIYVLLYADSTAVGLPDMTFQVAVG